MRAPALLGALLPLVAIYAALPSMALAQSQPPHARTSEAPVDVEAAWRERGFRMSLGFGYEALRDFTAPQRTRDVVVAIEPAVRMSGDWSASILLRYGIAGGDYEGIRWTVTPAVAWHPSERTWLSLGAGYGGMLLDATSFDSDFALECDGDGLAGIARAGFAWQVGELFAHGPALHLDLQMTRCSAEELQGDFAASEDVLLEEPATPDVAPWRQHWSFGFAWMLTWR